MTMINHGDCSTRIGGVPVVFCVAVARRIDNLMAVDANSVLPLRGREVYDGGRWSQPVALLYLTASYDHPACAGWGGGAVQRLVNASVSNSVLRPPGSHGGVPVENECFYRAIYLVEGYSVISSPQLWWICLFERLRDGSAVRERRNE
ncbi:hypothetical protein QTP88_014825 [Uroleucon formosanum]